MMRNRLGEIRRRGKQRSGLTLIELIVAFTILLILSTMALPVARVKVQREKERRLRDALSEMRKAIDRYKDMADAGKLGQIDPDTLGYPPTLEALVEGVPVQSAGMAGGLFGQGQQNPGQPGGAFGNTSRSGIGSNSQGGFGSSARSGSGRGIGGGFGGGFGASAGSGSSSSDSDDGEQTIRFLRRIPADPITGTSEWGLRSVQDDPESMGWGGQNVFDVYTKSMDTSLDGTRYSEW